MNASQDLFLDLLADMYAAEKTLTEALQKMANAATQEDLRRTMVSHAVETAGHVRKIEQIFDLFGQKAKIKKCPAMAGIVEEAEDTISLHNQSHRINQTLIIHGQKAELFEITSYANLREWAKLLKREEAARLIGEILAEEKANHACLNRLSLEYFKPVTHLTPMEAAA
jgi:ferritin-like metal-binding protein YciE